MKGHLIGDNEEEAPNQGPAAATDKAKAASKAAKKKDEPKKIQYWWTETDGKPEKELTPKDKLLKDDFQVQQAYNYLKAWVVIDDQKAAPATAKQ